MIKLSSQTPISQKTGVILILLGALSIGFMPSTAKIAYQEGANPLTAIIGTGVSFKLAYVLFFIGATVIGTTRASILSISEPVMIIVVAVLLIDERLTPIQWL
jgi:drug/metabolite transporter (DMT)-like permease